MPSMPGSGTDVPPLELEVVVPPLVEPPLVLEVVPPLVEPPLVLEVVPPLVEPPLVLDEVVPPLDEVLLVLDDELPWPQPGECLCPPDEPPQVLPQVA